MKLPIFIEGGSSGEWGWHSVGTFLECPQRFSFEHNMKLAAGTRDALVRGSMLHAGLAQYYARKWAEQNGEDPEGFASPADAIRKSAGEDDPAIGAKYLDLVLNTQAWYEHNWSHETVKILDVEVIMRTEITSSDGRVFPHTQRADLVVEDSNGKVWIWDHKSASRIDAKTYAGYAVSGQFQGLKHLGREYFGAQFAGVKVNLIQWPYKDDPPKFDRVPPEPAPAIERRWARVTADARAAIEDLRRTRDPQDWPRAMSEQTCVGRYGRCHFYEKCQWG